MTLRAIASVVVPGALVVAAAAIAWCSGGVYRDDDGRFSVELPDGWALRPGSEVTQANSALDVLQPGHTFRYTAKFAPMDAKGEPTTFVLVQWIPAELDGAPWSQIERALGSADVKRVGEDMGRKLGSVASELSIGQVAVDEARRRYVVRVSMEVEGRRLMGQCVGYVGRHGMGQLNCYAPEAEFAAVQAKFDAMADTFRYDTGHAYSEPSVLSGLNWDSILVRMLVFGGIGALVGVISWARRGTGRKSAVVRRRPRTTRRPPPPAGPR